MVLVYLPAKLGDFVKWPILIDLPYMEHMGKRRKVENLETMWETSQKLLSWKQFAIFVGGWFPLLCLKNRRRAISRLLKRRLIGKPESCWW